MSSSFALAQYESVLNLLRVTVVFDEEIPMIIVFVGKMLRLCYVLE